MAVAPVGPAALRDTEARLSAKGRRVFTVAGWNDVIRNAGIAAGNWWISHYGPLRWNVGYAMGKLGYSPGKKKMKKISKWGALPFQEDGLMRSNFNSRAKVDAKATKGGLRLFVVRFPIGHVITAKAMNSFKTIPPAEAKAIAREYRRAVIIGLQTGRTAHAAKLSAAATVKAAKKEAAKAKAKARSTRASRVSRKKRAQSQGTEP